MKIKICGLKRECDIDYVNEAMPDYAGFVFAESKRKISPEHAFKLRSALNPAIKSVGVFVNQDIDFVKNILETGIIDIVQLHGDEDIQYIQSVNAPVIKAVRLGIGGAGGPPKAVIKELRSPPEPGAGAKPLLLLFDGITAGSGKVFNWELIPKEINIPFFLAGGINAENISEAMNVFPCPYAIDVSSGVETDGVKDREKILEIVRRVRNG